MNHLQRYWPYIAALYTGGVVNALTGFSFMTWQWWAMCGPVLTALANGLAYRKLVLKVKEKW